MAREANDEGSDGKSSRTCVVTRVSGPPEAMIRFALAPDGAVVPDLRRRLPGRGVWTEGTAAVVAQAVRRRAFERGFRRTANATEALVAQVDELMARDCLQSLAMANKAGLVVTGAAKVEAEIASGKTVGLIQARDGAADGARKMAQAARRVFGPAAPPVVDLFGGAQLDLALGRSNVIHAALKPGAASEAFLARCRRLLVYRCGTAETDGLAGHDGTDE
ncbi:MAG: RNA-binding protein [Hyphomicrobiales bacterium]|nr:RNA-binding protein [Hyphomicrobiales bacterium]